MKIQRHRIPNTVFVPFEWTGSQWKVRVDLPRFLDPEPAAEYLAENPTLSMRDGKPVFLQWQERNEWRFIKQFLRGVGLPAEGAEH